MYDPDEYSRDLKGTASSTASAIKTGYQLIDFLRNLKPEEIAQMAVNDPNFQFTGQITDMRFFHEHAVMSMDMVTNIQDGELRAAVQDEFNRAARNGLIQIDPENRTIALTKEGQKYINQPAFKQAALRHVASMENQMQQALAENMGFPLNGSPNDIQFFQFADTLDLGEVMKSPNSEVAAKVLDGFKQFQAQGKVTIDGLKVTLTESGKQLLSSPFMKSAASAVKTVPTGEPISTAVVVAISAAKKAAAQTVKFVSP